METRLSYFDVYLELPADLLEQAFALNRRVVSFAGGGIDFDAGRIPHITLYMGLFPEAERAAIVRELKTVGAETPPLPIILREIETSRDGYVFWKVVADESLLRLHERVVMALNPMRRGAVREKYLEDQERFTKEECLYIMKYGFPWVMSRYRPHVTVGHLGEGATEAAESLGCPEARGEASRIVLGSVGEHGVILEAYETFPLTGSM